MPKRNIESQRENNKKKGEKLHEFRLWTNNKKIYWSLYDK
jgi:hypothetical protein